MRQLCLVLLLAGLPAATAAALGPSDNRGGAPPAAEILRGAVAATCGPETPGGRAPTDPEALLPALPGARLVAARLLGDPNAPFRQSDWRFVLPEGHELRLLRQLRATDEIIGVAAEYHEVAPGGGVRPRMTALARAGCRVVLGRRIDYGPEGRAQALVHLDEALTPTGQSEALNPPVPAGNDPGGVTVALFDSGVNYELPQIATRLARNAEGEALGYDYWDLDPLPFDSNPARSAFFPAHHGTTVASLLLREAPQARLLPYRYPRPDLARMHDMVLDAAGKDARVVAMAMGSPRRTDWMPFLRAAGARADMLFVVSAGNDGRDIDLTPVYPASADLENLLVVTSAESDGRLARGSNWGRASVDLMVPAENVEVIDHRGFVTRASGSSYAVARVAALAARLLARNPHWRARDLKTAILARASPSPALEAPRTRHGWIADPLAVAQSAAAP